MLIDGTNTDQPSRRPAGHGGHSEKINPSSFLLLVISKLGEVAENIRRLRAELCQQHGWIMDSYLLRRNEKAQE